MSTLRRGELVRSWARALAGLVYREITVRSRTDLSSGPVVLVSNHFGGLSDGILAVDATPRMPRVVARDLIWKVPVVGQLASAAGGIPVHRQADSGDGRARNDEMFRSCYEALADDEMILIFPEGITQDVPHIAEVKTGAARIALGAAASGVEGIRIVPLGLHYEDKSGFRTRALVHVGEAIDLDTWTREHGAAHGAADRAAVTELTALITRRLRAAAPDFEDWQTAHAFEQAAEVFLHEIDPDVAPTRYGDVALVAGVLEQGGSASAVGEAGDRYRQALRRSRTGDLAVVQAAGRRIGGKGRWWWDALLALVLLPYALIGLSLWFLPWLLVQGVKRLPLGAAERATFTPAAAMLAFAAEWGFIIWQAAQSGGPGSAALAMLLPPLFLGAFLLVVERAATAWGMWRSTRSGRDADLSDLTGLRNVVAQSIAEAL